MGHLRYPSTCQQIESKSVTDLDRNASRLRLRLQLPDPILGVLEIKISSMITSLAAAIAKTCVVSDSARVDGSSLRFMMFIFQRPTTRSTCKSRFSASSSDKFADRVPKSSPSRTSPLKLSIYFADFSSIPSNDFDPRVFASAQQINNFQPILSIVSFLLFLSPSPYRVRIKANLSVGTAENW